MEIIKTKDIPFWPLTLLAFAPIILQILGHFTLTDRDLYNAIFLGESGIIEVLTVLLLIPASIYAILCGKRFMQAKLYLAALLLFVYALGCFLFLGEELSWGQHIFKWQTPDYFLLHNESQETNLHNITGSKRGTIKWILVGGMFTGGVLAPLFAGWLKLPYRPAKHWIIWLIPTRICIAVTLFMAMSHVILKYLRANDIINTSTIWGIRIPEVTELYIAFFFAYYAASMYKRMTQTPNLKDRDLIIGP